MSAIFGLMDAARDPKVFALIQAAKEQDCLFAGDLAPDLREAAPYIVRLTENEPLWHAWRQEGWGQSWGIMCRASGTLPQVRRHFRHFLQAKLPDGHIVLFRFYDPRVWRLYLPTCSPDELARWFSGIEEYRAETEDGAGVHRYTLSSGALQIA